MRTAVVYNFLLEAGLIASIAILLLLFVRRFLRGALGSRVIYFAWLLIAIRLLCPLALPNPAINLIRPAYSNDPAIRPIADQIKVRFSDASQSVAEMAGVLEAGQQGAHPLARSLDAFSASTRDGSLSRLLMRLYLTGAGVTLCCFLFLNIRFRVKLKRARVAPLSGRLFEEYLAICRRRGVKPVPVYLADPLPGACLVGVLRPFIALPLAAAPKNAVHALDHEVCHLKGRDPFFGMLRLICCVIHWFNPLVWLAACMSRMDGELACDSRVTEALGAEERLAYANSLVLAAIRRSAPGIAVLATGMTMTGRRLEKRVQAILHGGKAKKGLALAFCLAAVTVLASTFATAEYIVPPVMPAVQEGLALAARSIASDEEAKAYARSLLQAALPGEDLKSAQLNVNERNGVYQVQCSARGNGFSGFVSFLRDGTVLTLKIGEDWLAARAAQRYDKTGALEKEAKEYIRRFARAYLPNVDLSAGELQCTGEGTYGEKRFMGFAFANAVSPVAYQFEMQIQPTVQMVFFLMDEALLPQLAAQGNEAAAASLKGQKAATVGGFAAVDRTEADPLYSPPSKEDISIDSALSFALQALYDRYGETAQTMGRFKLEFGFKKESAAYSEGRHWQLDFFGSNPYEDRYQVLVGSPGGAVLYAGGPYGETY